jgi:hypothetical protein
MKKNRSPNEWNESPGSRGPQEGVVCGKAGDFLGESNCFLPMDAFDLSRSHVALLAERQQQHYRHFGFLNLRLPSHAEA